MVPNVPTKIFSNSNVKFGRLNVHNDKKFFDAIDALPDTEYSLVWKFFLKKSIGHLCEVRSMGDGTVIISVFTGSIPKQQFFKNEKYQLIELSSNSGLNIKGQNKEQFMVPFKLKMKEDDINLEKVSALMEKNYLEKFEPGVRLYDNHLLEENSIVSLVSSNQKELEKATMKEPFPAEIEMEKSGTLKTGMLTEKEKQYNDMILEVDEKLKKIGSTLPTFNNSNKTSD
jgi:hypothetical protein